MECFGRYIEVTPHSASFGRMTKVAKVGAITTVTFENRGAETLVVMHDLYLSKEALDVASPPRVTRGSSETFEQLDELLVTLGASVGRS